jgi:hypothetical protein
MTVGHVTAAAVVRRFASPNGNFANPVCVIPGPQDSSGSSSSVSSSSYSPA